MSRRVFAILGGRVGEGGSKLSREVVLDEGAGGLVARCADGEDEEDSKGSGR